MIVRHGPRIGVGGGRRRDLLIGHRPHRRLSQRTFAAVGEDFHSGAVRPNSRGSNGLAHFASLAGLNDLPPCVRIEIPANAEAILTNAPDDARRWRERTRHAFQWSIAAGYEVSGFDAEAAPDCGYYLLTRTPRPSSTSAGP